MDGTQSLQRPRDKRVKKKILLKWNIKKIDSHIDRKNDLLSSESKFTQALHWTTVMTVRDKASSHRLLHAPKVQLSRTLEKPDMNVPQSHELGSE